MKLTSAVGKALKRAKGRPVTEAEILDRLGDIAPDATAEGVRDALAHLVLAGSVHPLGHGTYVAVRERGLVVGRMTVNRRGYGFVRPPTGGGDVYVSGRNMNGAMHGDTVAVRLQAKRGKLGRSGEVSYVVDRANASIVGRFEKQGRIGIVVPTDPRMRTEVFVGPQESMDARHNDIVVVRITRYPSDGQAAQGAVEEVLGPEGAAGIDIEVIIREHSLRTGFPAEVLAEANGIPEEAPPAEAGRRDLRDLFTVTIDPVDARDHDDAVSVERRGKGWRMWVHIADVSHYVPYGSPIDSEAQLRATSVYLVDRVLPMLPERLSNGTCSLKPGVDRFAMTVQMDLDKTGLVEAYELYDSVIRSDRKLNYDEVDEWLSSGEGFPDDETRRLLTEFRDAAAAIGKRRVQRGGLDFETVEPKVWLDAEGKPTHVTVRQRTVATNMIEESAILANEVIAGDMTSAEAPMVYRIHEEPDADALAEVATILQEFNYPIKDVHGASPLTFQKIVQFAHDRPEKLLINSLLLRALERARYSPELGGHFGLASEAYCHFTSPIRRYPDLIVHRLLKARLRGTLREDPAAALAAELEWLADHCSTMEREAEAAEDESVKVKLCQLMTEHIGERFTGIITGVTAFGIFVQLPNTAEGLVHVNSLTDDYYRHDAERFMLWGENTGREFRLGNTVDIVVANVVVSEKRIDFELA